MTSLLFPMGPKPTPSLNGIWEYWRPPGSSIVELGIVRGLNVALPVHFHEEDQLTFVLAGRRRFVIGDDVFDVAPGQGMHIPAGTPHRSLCEPSEVVCINMYTPTGAYAARDLISSLSRHWRRTGQIGWHDLTIIAEDHRCIVENGASLMGEQVSSEPWETVRQAAQCAGMSCEGFFPSVQKTSRHAAARVLAAGETERRATTAPDGRAHRGGRRGDRLLRPKPSGPLFSACVRRDPGSIPGGVGHIRSRPLLPRPAIDPPRSAAWKVPMRARALLGSTA
jgi:hypothetical protein